MKTVFWVAVAACALMSLNVWADPIDASVPDASVGQGSADMMGEENDTQGAPCLDSRSCDARTTCVNGRCVPTKPRDASGCSTTAMLMPAMSMALLAWRRRRP